MSTKIESTKTTVHVHHVQVNFEKSSLPRQYLIINVEMNQVFHAMMRIFHYFSDWDSHGLILTSFHLKR